VHLWCSSCHWLFRNIDGSAAFTKYIRLKNAPILGMALTCRWSLSFLRSRNLQSGAGAVQPPASFAAARYPCFGWGSLSLPGVWEVGCPRLGVRVWTFSVWVGVAGRQEVGGALNCSEFEEWGYGLWWSHREQGAESIFDLDQFSLFCRAHLTHSPHTTHTHGPTSNLPKML
jgi:hypothetical protein